MRWLNCERNFPVNEIRVDFSRRVLKEIERLNRKYPRTLDEVEKLVEQLKAGKRPGDKIPDIGYNVFKVRLKNPSAGRGKQGGFRAIYYVRIAEHIILLTIYSKSEREDISAGDIQHVIDDIEGD